MKPSSPEFRLCEGKISGILVPMERAFGRCTDQRVFRKGWRTDIAHFLASHIPVQVSVLLTMIPAALFFRWAVDAEFQAIVASQPVPLQFIEALVLADLFASIQAVFIHANVGFRFGGLRHLLVTPQFHHWHHTAQREALDKNFAVHLPLIDWLFGTYHLPKDQWPQVYGIAGKPVPDGYWKQLWVPFSRTNG